MKIAQNTLIYPASVKKEVKLCMKTLLKILQNPTLCPIISY